MPGTLRSRAPAWSTLLLLFASTLAAGVEVGEPLGAALDRLAGSGLRLVYSTALVTPDLRVRAVPRPGPPVEVARELLAQHGLALEPMQPGAYVVVRAAAGDAPVGGSVAGQGGAPVGDAAAPLIEVSILASRYRIDQQSEFAPVEITGEDLAARPGVDADALRVTRLLPGTATNGLSARAYVRGGRADELGVWFDGVPLFEPFHFKDFQGLLGILDPATVGNLDFWSGVHPARFGGRLSGVLDIAPRAWNGENHHEIGASLLYAHALSQGRLEAVPLEWLVAVRKSTIDQIMKLAEERTGEPEFLDLLVRLAWRFDGGSSVAAGWLVLDDGLTANASDDTERARARYRDGTAWLRGTWRIDDDLEVRGLVSRTERHTRRVGTVDRAGSATGALEDRRFMDANTARLELGGRHGRVRYTLGGELMDHDTSYEYAANAVFDPLLAAALGRPDALSHDLTLVAGGQSYAAYASALIGLSPRLDVDLGVRWDTQAYRPAFDDSQWSPRVGIEYRPREGSALRVSFGHLSQPERPDELQVTDGDPQFHAVQTATQAVVALEHRLAKDQRIRAEVFDKRMSHVRPVHENILDPVTLLPEIEVDRVPVAPRSSRAYGAELSWYWEPRGPWSASLGYSWSEVTDHFDDSRALRSWDQRHAAVAGLTWTRDPWQLSGSLFWHSGWRRNDLRVEVSPEGEAQLVLSPRNAGTWPDYVSLDLRASWQRPLPVGTLQVFAEISNLANNDNYCCTEYHLAVPGDAASLEGERSTWLPRYGLIGVKWILP